VAEALAGLPGVVGVEAGPPDGLPGAPFVVSTRELEPVQRELARSMVARGWVPLEMRAEPVTLEDLFVRVVRGRGDGPGA